MVKVSIVDPKRKDRNMREPGSWLAVIFFLLIFIGIIVVIIEKQEQTIKHTIAMAALLAPILVVSMPALKYGLFKSPATVGEIIIDGDKLTVITEKDRMEIESSQVALFRMTYTGYVMAAGAMDHATGNSFELRLKSGELIAGNIFLRSKREKELFKRELYRFAEGDFEPDIESKVTATWKEF